MVDSVAQEEPLSVEDVLEILDEASQLRGYARALEEKSRSLEQATGELRAANEQLQSLDHLKDDFMSSVTHELRTPLTSIRALSELMLDTADMEPGQREEFLAHHRLRERAADPARQPGARPRQDRGRRRRVAFDRRRPARARRRTRSAPPPSCSASAARRSSLDLPDAVPALRADPDRLTQVMLNLLSNAAKFVPAERRPRRGRACARDGDDLVVSVARQRPRRALRRAGHRLREVPPGRRRADPAAGHRPRASDQPPDRRSSRRNHVAGIGTGPGRVLRLPPAAPAGGKRTWARRC